MSNVVFKCPLWWCCWICQSTGGQMLNPNVRFSSWKHNGNCADKNVWHLQQNALQMTSKFFLYFLLVFNDDKRTRQNPAELRGEGDKRLIAMLISDDWFVSISQGGGLDDVEWPMQDAILSYWFTVGGWCDSMPFVFLMTNDHTEEQGIRTACHRYDERIISKLVWRQW